MRNPPPPQHPAQRPSNGQPLVRILRAARPRRITLGWPTAGLLLAALLLLASPATASAAPQPEAPTAWLKGRPFRLEVVHTPQAQRKGLAGRKTLPADFGMLFVYRQKARHGFWMRGMLTAIDIIWLDNQQVVHIAHSVPPPLPGQEAASLRVYKPPRPANLVLEVAAGRAKALGLRVGERIRLKF